MWKDWLAFSRNEQHGILLLFAIVLILLLLRLVLPLLVCPEVVVSTQAYDDAFVIEADTVEVEPSCLLSDAMQVEWKSFDPNTVADSQLARMGVPPQVITNWRKYLKAGGRFFSEEEIRKIYGLDDRLADRLVQYANCEQTKAIVHSGEKNSDRNNPMAGVRLSGHEISLVANESAPVQAGEGGVPPKEKILTEPSVRLDVNSVDAETLLQLRGLGPVLSQRIVDFRGALGGFARVSQIEEVYGLSGELYDQLADRFVVDTTKIRRLNLNRASVRRLMAHPYISFYQARDIVAYRKKNGSLAGIDDLKKITSFNREQIERISPYLTFYSDSVPE